MPSVETGTSLRQVISRDVTSLSAVTVRVELGSVAMRAAALDVVKTGELHPSRVAWDAGTFAAGNTYITDISGAFPAIAASGQGILVVDTSSVDRVDFYLSTNGASEVYVDLWEDESEIYAGVSSFTPVNYDLPVAGAAGPGLLASHLRGIDAKFAGFGNLPTAAYYFFSRCGDGSGTTLSDEGAYWLQFANPAASANDGSITDASNSWGTSGKFATADQTDADQAARLANSFDWELQDGDSVIVALQLNGTPAAAAREVLGNSLGAGSSGLRFRVLSNGGLTVGCADGVNSVFTNSATGLIDSSEHDIIFAIDGIEKTQFLWYDGTVDTSVNGVSVSAVTGTTGDGTTFAIGAGAGSNNTIAATFDNVHIVILRNRGLPANMAALVAAYSAAPATAWTEGQLA